MNVYHINQRFCARNTGTNTPHNCACEPRARVHSHLLTHSLTYSNKQTNKHTHIFNSIIRFRFIAIQRHTFRLRFFLSCVCLLLLLFGQSESHTRSVRSKKKCNKRQPHSCEMFTAFEVERQKKQGERASERASG